MDRDPHHVLLVVTDEARRERIAKALEAAGLQVDATTGLADARLRMRRGRAGVALVEVDGSGRDGAICALAEEAPTLPLVATGPLSAGAILGALRDGARDYLPEDPQLDGEWAARLQRAATASRLDDRPDGARDAVLAAIRDAESSREAARRVRRALANRTSAFRDLEEIYRNDLERMLVLFESVAEGLVFADRGGEVVLMNPAAGALLSCSPLEAVGKRIVAVRGDPRLLEALAEECAVACVSGCGERLVHDGRRRRILVRTIPTPRGSSPGTGILGLLRDVTSEVRSARDRSILLRRAARRLRSLAARLGVGAGRRAGVLGGALESEAALLEEAARAEIASIPGTRRARASRRVASPVSSLP